MSTVPGPTANPSAAIDSDVERLHQLGYAQELRRRMGGFSNFAVSFTIISVAVGVVLLFSGGYWLLSARKWFTGPKAQGDEAALEKIESGFGQVGLGGERTREEIV